jgi:F-type H+-transporting ATPase subunit gamma
MSDLKRLRSRVKSIKATQKITKAMQMVAASKLKKIKDQINDSEPYLLTLREMIAGVSSSGGDLSDAEKVFFDQASLESRPILFVVITSERGLCGGFNSAIIKKLRVDINEAQRQSKEFKIIIIGKKGYDALKGKYASKICDYFVVTKENQKILPIEIKHHILKLVAEGKIGACNLYYSQFKNVITQIPTSLQIFPIDKDISDNKKPVGSIVNSGAFGARSEESKPIEYNYELEGNGLIMGMIDLYLLGQLNYSMLQNRAGEEGARMSAMDSATKNAGDMIDSLTLKLNRTRQAVITKELIEIISGAEAV